MTDETTPDAVEARDPLDGLEQLRRIIDEQPEPAPESVMLGLDYCYAEWVAERARHAEEVAALRDQLRKVEGERDALAVRMDLPASQLLMVGSELCGDGKIDPNDHRDPRWTPTLQLPPPGVTGEDVVHPTRRDHRSTRSVYSARAAVRYAPAKPRSGSP